MRNTKRIVEVAEQKDIDWFFIDHAYLYHQRHSMFEKYGDMRNCIFRVCKNNYVINKITDTDDRRYLELKATFAKDDELEILDWKKGGKHIVVFPPSWWLCKNLGMKAEDVLKNTVNELKKHTDREIIFRNKPRPGNKWWNTDIKDDLKNCYALVTNYSLSAFDALLNYVPVFAEANSVMGPVTSRDISKIEKPLRPGRKTMEEWLKFVSENQFTLKEMANGKAYEILKYQNED